MQKSEQINELAQALCKAQSELKPAVRDSENPFFKSKYADYLSTWNACRDALKNNELAVTQVLEPSQMGPLLVTMLIHKSGQWISGSQPVCAVKNDPQSLGSAITYARRYGLSAILGMAQEDDDGESAMARPQQQAPKNQFNNTLSGEPGDFVMPFGNQKGTKLKELKAEEFKGNTKAPIDVLTGARDWAVKNNKFVEFQLAANAYLSNLDNVLGDDLPEFGPQ